MSVERAALDLIYELRRAALCAPTREASLLHERAADALAERDAEIAALRARIPNVEEATVLRSRVKQIVDNTLTLESDIRRLYALVVARQKGPTDE